MPASEITQAFRTLDARLAARRLAALDLRMRAVLVLITVLVSGFLFWQVRIPLDGLVHMRSPLKGFAWLVWRFVALAFAAGSLAAWRQAMIAARPPGPEWLALPVAPALVARHLLAESRLPALATFPLAVAILIAGIGLLPPLWLVLLGLAFVVAWLELTRLGALLARHAAAARVATPRALPAATRVLLGAGRGGRVRRRAPPRWLALSPAQALRRLDLTLSLRSSAARTRLVFVVLALAASLLVWLRPVPAIERRAESFACFAIASSALGAWAIARVCGDPPSTLRPLPLGLRALWWARFAPMSVALIAIALIDALIAPGLGVPARMGLLVGAAVPGLAIATLGLHYAITLAPRANLAENLYYGWLGIAIASSLMIPLLGWIVLLAGLIHSTRRLPRWWTPEIA